MNRPQSDDATTNNEDKNEQSIDMKPLTNNKHLNHKLSAIEGQQNKVEATLLVTTPTTDRTRTEKGEQNVLSVSIVNGNIDLQFHQTKNPRFNRYWSHAVLHERGPGIHSVETVSY